MSSLVRRAIAHWRRHGAASTYRTTGRYLTRRVAEWFVLDASGSRLADYATAVTTVEPGYSMDLTYSGRNDELPAALQRRAGDIEIPPRIVYELPDAELVGGSDVIRLGPTYTAASTVGATEPQVGLARKQFVKAVGTRRALVDALPSRTDGDRECAFVLAGRKRQYAHWFYETLPKIRAFEQYAEDTGEEPTLVVAGPLSSWQRTSLERLGYIPDAYVEHAKGRLSVDRLLVPSHRLRRGSGEFVPSPVDLRELRERLTAAVDETSGFATRLYVSRADADRRHVQNESAVLDVLEPLGFRKIVPGELPYEQQIEAFAGADVLVGPHGAGLTNMLYATDATVVELLVDGAPTPHFFVMATELGLDYNFHLCTPVEQEGVEARHWDMIADPERLRDRVESL